MRLLLLVLLSPLLVAVCLHAQDTSKAVCPCNVKTHKLPPKQPPKPKPAPCCECPTQKRCGTQPSQEPDPKSGCCPEHPDNTAGDDNTSGGSFTSQVTPEPAVNQQGPPPAQVLKKDAVPGERIEADAPAFDPARDAVWVGKTRVDPASVKKVGDRISFVLPPDARGTLVVRIQPASLSRPPETPPAGKDAANAIHIEQVKFWQYQAVALAAAFSVLAIISLVVVSLAGVSQTEADAHTTRNIWAKRADRWLVDHQTHSYSLQRMQFFTWTGAAVLAFSYDLYCLQIVRAVSAFPNLPPGVVKILAVSAGTSLLGMGIRALKGSEGAGSNKPSFKDLITTGDIVAADKVQLLVWTVVGVLAFLVVVLAEPPLQVSGQIPDLPDALWQLAGLSAATYLGGKIVRDPGPVISQVLATIGNAGVVSFDLRGSSLSQDAAFYTRRNQAPPEKIPFNLISNGEVGADKAQLPKVTVPGDASNPRFAKGLRLFIDPAAKLAGGNADEKAELSFIIENPDGQRAECPYELKPAAEPSA